MLTSARVTRPAVLAFLAALLVACDSDAHVLPTSTATVAPATVGATSTPARTPTATPSPRPSPTPAADPVYVFPTAPVSAAGFDTEVNGHGYPATDIFAALGTEVVAVTSGVIAFINRVDTWADPPDDGAARGGLYLAVLGDDGIQYYFSHLSEIRADLEVGTRVEARETLGAVGVSGNAAGTPPHLHFGISCPTQPEDWERRRGEFDPRPYLVAWAAGDAHRSPAEDHLASCR